MRGAREIVKLLGYTQYNKFANAIKKARESFNRWELRFQHPQKAFLYDKTITLCLLQHRTHLTYWCKTEHTKDF
jgi:hypothetical protein